MANKDKAHIKDARLIFGWKSWGTVTTFEEVWCIIWVLCVILEIYHPALAIASPDTKHSSCVLICANAMSSPQPQIISGNWIIRSRFLEVASRQPSNGKKKQPQTNWYWILIKSQNCINTYTNWLITVSFPNCIFNCVNLSNLNHYVG